MASYRLGVTDEFEPLISAEIAGERLALTPAQVAVEFAGFLLAGELRFRWSEIEARLQRRRQSPMPARAASPAKCKRRPRSAHSTRLVSRETLNERRERFPISTQRRS